MFRVSATIIFAAVTSLAGLVAAAPVAANETIRSTDDWVITVYGSGGCNDELTSLGGTSGTGCIDTGSNAYSILWSSTSAWQAILYQEPGCVAYDGQTEVFNDSDNEQCYTAALYGKGPDYTQSFQVVAT